MDQPLATGDPSTADASTIRGWLETGARRHPDKPFVISIDEGRTVSYAEALAVVRRIGAALKRRGFVANDRVALLSNNSLDHLMAYYGVMFYGATICTIHVEMNALVIDELIGMLAPKLVLVEDGLGLDIQIESAEAEVLPLAGFLAALPDGNDANLAPVNRPDDIASIFYTSGTTSTPKGVPCTFRDLETNVRHVTEAFGIRATDTIFDYRSFNWMSAQTLSALGALSAGATLVIARKFSRSRFFAWICDHRVTIAAGNPTMINMLSTAPVPIAGSALDTLRYITSSSAPLLAEDWRRFEQQYGIRIVQGYGSSETGWIAASSESETKPGSVGRPLAYHRLAITDAEGRSLPTGEIGLVELGSGPDAAFRYLGETGDVVVHARGRHRTGDLGYLDADGFLFLTGREKDLIIRGGVNISPVEIDNILNQMDGVAEAACFGAADPIYGEEVAAAIVALPHAMLSEDQVIAWCRTRLAESKVPKRIVFCAELPKTDRGKLDRKALRLE